jgi:hypothetical protein
MKYFSLGMAFILFMGSAALAVAGNPRSPGDPTYHLGKSVASVMHKIGQDVKKGKLTKAQAAQLRRQVNAIVSAQPVGSLSQQQLKQVDAQLKQIYNSL